MTALEESLLRLQGAKGLTASAVVNDLVKFQRLMTVDLDMAIVRARRAVDHIARAVARSTGSTPGTKPGLGSTPTVDITWLRDDSLEDSNNLPAPGVLAAEIVEELEAALAQFAVLAASLPVDDG